MHAMPLKLQRKKKKKKKRSVIVWEEHCITMIYPLLIQSNAADSPSLFQEHPVPTHTLAHIQTWKLQYNLLAAEQLQWPPCERFKAFLRGSSGMGKCLFHSSHQWGTWTGPLIQSLKLAGYIFLWCSMLFYPVQWCETCCATVYYVEIYLSVNIYGCLVFWGYMVLQG